MSDLPEKHRFQRRIVLFWLRMLSVIALAVMRSSVHGVSTAISDADWLVLGLYILWVLTGTIIPARFFSRQGFLLGIFLADTCFAVILLRDLSVVYGDLFLIYFVTIFVAVLARTVAGGAGAAALSILLYALLQYLRTGVPFNMDPSVLVRYPFLFITGILCGFLSEESRKEDVDTRRLKETSVMLAEKVDLATRKLSDSNRHLKAMLEYHHRILSSIQTGIIVAHKDGKVRTFNSEATKITGCMEETVVGQPLDRLPERLASLASGMMRTLVDGRGFSVEDVDLVTERGETKQISLDVSVMKSESGEILGVIATVKDMSLMHQMETQLARAERLSALGEMAAGVAHEIKNPLNAIQGFSQRLVNKLEDPTLKKYADTIQREVLRLDSIINDVLEYSRTTKPACQPTDLHSLIEEVVQYSAEKIERAGVTIVKQLSPNIPKIPLDPNKIKQVLLNLTLNAIHAMPNGGTLTFMTSLQEGMAGGSVNSTDPSQWVSQVFLQQKTVVLTIRDTGAGIAKENLSKLFHPFFTTKTTGTGLGLSICLKIIEAHGGTIKVSSVLGMGATFTLQFPLEG